MNEQKSIKSLFSWALIKAPEHYMSDPYEPMLLFADDGFATQLIYLCRSQEQLSLYYDDNANQLVDKTQIWACRIEIDESDVITFINHQFKRRDLTKRYELAIWVNIKTYMSFTTFLNFR